MKPMKKAIIFILVFSLAVFGLITSMLVKHNNKEKELAKQMQSKSAIDGMLDASAKEDKKMRESQMNKVPGGSSSASNGDKEDKGFIRGNIDEIHDDYIVMETSNYDGMTFYKVLIPDELKPKLKNFKTEMSIDVKGTKTSEEKKDKYIYVIMQATDIGKL